jgi:fatty acid-binding protein DegV
MDTKQPSSGDLKELQRQHKKDMQVNNDSSSSSTASSTPSLLERRQSSRSQQQHVDNESTSMISPMPTGAERMAALRDLGATFEEGQKSIAKVATPTETIVPSFVDSNHLEVRFIK